MTLTMVDKGLGERRRHFGNALADALAVRQITQQQLGDTLGVTQSSISAWKSGESEPAAEVVFAVEKALELPPGHLSRHLGYLPPAAVDKPATTFEDVVLSDPLLDDGQKQGVLALYREFIAQSRRRRRQRRAKD